VPTYEYRCLDCAHEYEKREGFDAPALQGCPTCGGTARRVIHAAPVVFKGSGFYVTDNRKSAPEAESESKAGSTAESKPEPAKTGEGSAGKDAEPAAAS
jgi:putative FmdB family regulatory protein